MSKEESSIKKSCKIIISGMENNREKYNLEILGAIKNEIEIKHKSSIARKYLNW